MDLDLAESKEGKNIAKGEYVGILKDVAVTNFRNHLERLTKPAKVLSNSAVEIRMWHYLKAYVNFYSCFKVIYFFYST
jgi:hypothetical protein